MANANLARHVVLFILAVISVFGTAHASGLRADASLAQGIAPYELRVETQGIPDFDERGATSNVVLDFYVGAAASITSLRWDVNLTSYAGSYLSEMQMTFTDTAGNGVTFTPGNGDDFDGTMQYAGFQELGELGQIFAVGADGILRLEFHDGFKDLAFDEPEGMWNAGTLTFGIAPVPEPSTAAMLLGGLLLFSRALSPRRRATRRDSVSE